MARVVYSRLAARDIQDIFSYGVGAFGLAQAERYDADIQRAVDTIVQFPRIGRVYVTRAGNAYRRFAVGAHVVFYKIDTDGVFVGRILHERMDFDDHL